MIKTGLPIYLASKSPRRKKLLEQINLKFSILKVDANEDVRNGEKPAALVKRLARDKMKEAEVQLNRKKKENKSIIITADTIVVIDGKILNKPVDKKDAERILKLLSGRTHTVYTGFAVNNTYNKKIIVDFEKTQVTFRKLDDKEITDYINTGSPMDKAGAYGIQDDFGAVFIKKINGCYYNVVGLPLAKVYGSLKKVV